MRWWMMLGMALIAMACEQDPQLEPTSAAVTHAQADVGDDAAAARFRKVFDALHELDLRIATTSPTPE